MQKFFCNTLYLKDFIIHSESLLDPRSKIIWISQEKERYDSQNKTR